MGSEAPLAKALGTTSCPYHTRLVLRDGNGHFRYHLPIHVASSLRVPLESSLKHAVEMM